MLEKIKYLIKSNPVLVGATAVAVGNLVRDIVGSGVNARTAIETAILYIVGFMQRAKVVPVANIPLDNPLNPANKDK